MPSCLISHINDSMVLPTSSSCDDNSVSSTIDTTSSPKLIERVAQAGQKCQRHVAFDACADLYYASTHFCKEDTKDLWYNGDDYHAFKENHVENTKNIIKSGMAEKKHHNGGFLYIMEEVYQSCVEDLDLDLEEEEELAFALSADLCGLEKLSVRTIRNDKKMRRQELMNAIMDVQGIVSIRYQYTEEECACLMAAASLEISRASKQLAVYLARAHAANERS